MSEWISVKERLPAADQKVLIWFPRSQHIEDAVLFEEGGNLRYTLFDGDCLMAEFPTHWMPLPEPPK